MIKNIWNLKHHFAAVPAIKNDGIILFLFILLNFSLKNHRPIILLVLSWATSVNFIDLIIINIFYLCKRFCGHFLIPIRLTRIEPDARLAQVTFWPDGIILNLVHICTWTIPSCTKNGEIWRTKCTVFLLKNCQS